MKKVIRSAAALMLAAVVLCAPVWALSAQHAVVLDAATGRILYEKDASCRCLIASTTKIMTGLLICEDCDLNRQVVIPPEAVGVEGTSVYLKAGECLRVEELLYSMLLHSGNDAAAALAIVHSGSIAAFAQRMNERAQALGLTKTHFANPHGLDDDGNYSTAVDLARLTATAMENETFARVVGSKHYRFGQRCLTNHNKLLWRCEGAEGVKTGFTKAAGRILVSSVRRQGRRLICVTMKAPDDWNDHCALYDDCYTKFSYQPLCRKGQIMGAVLSPSGTVAGYAAASCDTGSLLMAGESVDAVRITMGCGSECGSECGCAAFLVQGRTVAVCPLERITMDAGRDSV